jgi:NADH-quinone oxidoreductase subunit L
MFVGLGVGGYSLGIFHLFTHAFFKALLFLGAGSVIVAMHHEQDMRRMGGLWRNIPFTFAMMTIGTLALTGFPLTSGYFSKDAIIEAAYASDRFGASYGYLMTTVAAGLTSFYSWRLVFLTFFGPKQWAGDSHSGESAAPVVVAALHGHDEHGATAPGHDDHGHDAQGHHGHHLDPHESPITMLAPLGVLALGALFAGYIFHGYFIGEGVAEFWKSSLYFGPGNHILEEMEHIPELAKQAPTLLMVTGFLVALYVYILAPGTAARLANAMPSLYRFLLNKWYFDELYELIFVRPTKWLGRFLWKKGDGMIIDGLGPDGISARVLDVTRSVVRLQTGYLYHYAFAMLIGVAGLITWFMFGAGAQ